MAGPGPFPLSILDACLLDIARGSIAAKRSSSIKQRFGQQGLLLFLSLTTLMSSSPSVEQSTQTAGSVAFPVSYDSQQLASALPLQL
jgi:hypothetical protein